MSKYKAELKILGRLYKSTGKTVEEAISNLKVSGGRGMAVLTVTKGKDSRWKVLNAVTTVRLFGQASPTLKAGAMKQILTRFEI